ncbi:M23 family metallopeptidase [Microbacterium sp.]|uniref:M23 family metallopeptidase n=1 Tax=Microbacterium sp. TaxID=51671 RepID=UPI0025D6FDFF|nr:M23 family metallopeptidase [Microbacterium sp.]
MTPDTPMAGGAPTRRDRRRTSALTAQGEPGVLTRAEYRRLAAEAAASASRSSQPALALGLPPESASTAAADPDRSVDEFEFAARLFSFTGASQVQAPPGRDCEAMTSVAAVDVNVARAEGHGRVGFVVQRVAAASFSIGVIAVAGLLAVGATMPAAVASASGPGADLALAKSATTTAPDEIQAFVASSEAGAAGLERTESYDVASMVDLAADSGVTLFAGTWINNADGPIQWPFPVGVPISASYGSASYLSQFASPHRGVDLTPGAGAEIHAIAAGTVRIATTAGGDYGVTVVIDHIIDGQLVSTRYGHLQYGSLEVEQGDTVAAGQVIGAVGQTGKATGPHLHLEVLLGGATQTDPMPWLYEHTTGSHTVG